MSSFESRPRGAHAIGVCSAIGAVVMSCVVVVGVQHRAEAQEADAEPPDGRPGARAQAAPPASPPAPPTVVPSTAPPQVADEPSAAEGAVPAEIIHIEQAAPAEAASSVHLDACDLRMRPHSSPSDLFRQTPGLVVAQHAGGGKSDQYFLRGFDADHGTDVALFFDGVPINLTSHGHGQGYADSHFIIPETVAGLEVHKGPYAARFGDFATAGAFELSTIDEVPGTTVWLSGGTELAGPVAFERLSSRFVGLGSPSLAGGHALLAAEIAKTDGPFVHPQRFQRGNALAKWTGALGAGRLTLTTTFYNARWNQSGQIPSAEVAAGRIDRFGAIDPTEGGASSRTSAVIAYDLPDARGGHWHAQAYVVDYRLRLYSNFTLFARDPVNGDQIEQLDARTLAGGTVEHRRVQHLGPVVGQLALGVQVRADDAETGLYHDAARERLATCFDQGANPCNHSLARVRNLAVYVEEDLFPRDWLHVIAGLRGDAFTWDVEDLDPETSLSPESTGGTAQKLMVSPKLSVILSPTPLVDVFVNGGGGFHSNDARAAVAINGKGALARAWGAEVGARVRALPTLQVSAAAWWLGLSSEQVWNGDSGGTEPSDPTRRLGLDLDARWDATRWLRLDADVALARSTFVANVGNGGALALAPRLMGNGGVTAHDGARFVALRARGIGPRPANEDGTLTAEGYLVVDLVAGWTQGPWQLGLTVTNLLDADWREAQFAEVSRVSPTAEVVEDVHFTPGAPLGVVVSLGATI